MNFHEYEKQNSSRRFFLSQPPGRYKRKPDETKEQN
jgi:hypothetical protein